LPLEAAYLDSDRLIVSFSRGGSVRWWFFPRNGDPYPLTDELAVTSHVQLTADRATGVAERTTVRGSITVVDVATGRATEVVGDSASQPSYPQLDGRGNVYYGAVTPGGGAVFRIEGGQGTGRLLLRGVSHPRVSADGSVAVGVMDDAIVRFDIDGGAATTLVKDPYARPIEITGDDKALVFASSKLGHQQPWLVPLEGGEPRRLSEKYLAARMLWLSPDGTQALFRSDGAATLLCAFPAFEPCREVPVVAGPFSADGRTVFAVDPRDPKNLLAQPLDGSPARPLTNFTDRVIDHFTLSPDRTRIAIERNSRSSDVVLVKGLKL
jgi:hypothetical protein